ncbi:NAD(+) hydrolase sarm1 isoform X1 [Rhipicephalus sanguineus]|uniref:NAD(+) hydrolase sarm1 isoform X1 n=2 Tax=Rhipicephalus sanguineus TaxID=34632 RepID=UPI001894C2FA|nr:NAD(+) hydrolase sarm1 isoform X1 [Rhipicephalus sanguineus]
MADVNRLRRIKRSCQKMRSCRRLGVLRAVVIPSEPPDRSSRLRNDLPVTPREGSKTARWCFGLASPLAVTVKPLLMADISPERPSTPPKGTPVTSPNGTGADISSVVENIAKATQLSEKLNTVSSSSYSASEKHSSSSQMLKSSTTAASSSGSLLNKKSQLLHHSLASSQQQTQQQQKEEQQQLFQQENRSTTNYSRSVSVSSSSSSTDSRLKTISSQRGYTVDCGTPEASDEGRVRESTPSEVRFEQKRVTSSAKSKLVADGVTAEKSATTNKELKRLQAGDITFQEKQHSQAMKARMEGEGFSAEKIAAVKQDQKQLKMGDTLHQQQKTAAASASKMSTEDYTAEEISMAKKEERQMYTQGVLQQEKSAASSASSKVFISSKGVSKSSASHQTVKHMDYSSGGSSCASPIVTSPTQEMFSSGLPPLPSNQRLAVGQGLADELDTLRSPLSQTEVDKAISRFASRMALCVEQLKTATEDEAVELLATMSVIIRKAWAVPTYGHDLGFTMCNILRTNGGLDVILKNCSSGSEELQFASARLLEQCLSTENRSYVVEHGLEPVVKVACLCSFNNQGAYSRVGTGILCHLFKHSESTCSELIRLGALKSILYDCRTSDVETLRHCASALANLSLYGGPENHQAMIKHKAPMWLFPLAFNLDDNIKYYACLAIAALVANKEIEAAVMKSGTLDLVEPFVTSHHPEEFAKSHVAHVHGQSKDWLLRFVPVLDSNREEARSLAAFHFAMEAGIKKRQGNTSVFAEIGALEALRKVASSPNAIASKFAAQALQLIGEEVPHKLSQQVPLWTVEDVKEWVKQIGFTNYASEFVSSRVDGDLLLQLDEPMLKEDIGIKNGILRRRFLRELSQLKRMADYSSVDTTNVNQILQSLGSDFSQYTYRMLQSGVDMDSLKMLNDDQLFKECGIDNSIHRLRIGQAIRGLNQCADEADEIERNKSLDVFVSYRRSNGSQLASLLKVHLQLRGFSVFIDVERLEAGKFDNNLLNSIRQAKHFLLVLTPNALDRCVGDNDRKDWVHREIVEALQSQCNIIPILDNFQWPESEVLPEDMRAVCYFNGVRWIHDYQDACVDKLERFMRGEMNVRSDGPLGRYVGMGGPGTPGTPSTMASCRAAVYQRSASNDSTKGSTGSDRESSNGRAPTEQPQAQLPAQPHC